MNEIWAVVVLECMNLDPTRCTVKAEHPMFGMNSEKECREMLGSIYYGVRDWNQGMHYRPECRRVKNRWVGGELK